MKEKFWGHMTALKYQIYYLDEYMEESYKWDNYINIFTAVTSASSIGAWAIWKDSKCVWIWSSIIAISQVINAIKTQLPFSKRIKFLPKLTSELGELYNEYDYLWLDVSNDRLTDKQINDELKKLVSKDDKISDKYLNENHLPYKSKLANKAQSKLEQYYNNYY
ncbi:hypothetical protein FC754_03030 [Clostridium botulinum]|nr:hypothetical protein [Clostridium botulinum]